MAVKPFGCLDEAMLILVSQLVSRTSVPGVAVLDVFVRLMMFFKTYVTFANNFDTAIATIGQLRARPGFHNFLR